MTDVTQRGDWIKNQPTLLELCSKLAQAQVIALDTEFAGERRYFPRFDLLQVATADVVAAVDVHAGLDLAPLAEVLRTRTVLVHSASQDVAILHRELKVVPAAVFDTQVAAAMVGYGSPISYGALVQKITGTVLGKTESLSDWSRRPLSREQLEYALDDVRYLLPVYEHLKERLEALGRTAWFEEESRQQLLPEKFALPDPQTRWQKLYGLTGMTARQLLVLQALAAWRETYGVNKNQPPRSILPDEVLIHLSRRPPKTLQGLREFRHIFDRTIQTCGDGILATIKQAMEKPEELGLPLLARVHSPALPPGLVTLLDAIVRAQAEVQSIAPGLLASPQELEQLAVAVKEGLPLEGPITQGWRYQLAGEAVVRVLRGELQVKIHPTSLALELVSA